MIVPEDRLYQFVRHTAPIRIERGLMLGQRNRRLGMEGADSWVNLPGKWLSGNNKAPTPNPDNTPFLNRRRNVGAQAFLAQSKMAREFFDELFSPIKGGRIVLRQMRRTPSGVESREDFFVWPKNLNDLIKRALTESQQWNAYFAPAIRNRPNSHPGYAFAVPAIWVAFNLKELSQQQALQRLNKAPFKPSAVFASGSTLTCYWFVDEALGGKELEVLHILHNRILKLLNVKESESSDPFLSSAGLKEFQYDVESVLPVPGSITHETDPPTTVKRIIWNPGERHKLEMIIEHFISKDTPTPEPRGESSKGGSSEPKAKLETRAADTLELKPPLFPKDAIGLAPEAFEKIIGAYQGRSEAPPPFILFSLATWAGALLGRSVHNSFQGPLYPLMYSVLVAPAGFRKTTGEKNARNALIPEDFDPKTFGMNERQGSFGSGVALLEGLAAAEKEAGAGAVMLWRPPEWSGVLRASEREGGRDIVPVLLGAFDGFRNYTHVVRSRPKDGVGGPIELERPGLSIISTAQEVMLRNHLTSETMGLGLASRILFVYHSSPIKPVPFPEQLYNGPSWSILKTAGESVRDAVRYWKERAENMPDGVPIWIHTNSKVAEYWSRWYIPWREAQQEAKPSSEADRTAELHVRIPEYVRRLALIRAALSRRLEIDVDDLKWGRAMAEYAGDCATFLSWGAGVGETRQDARTRALVEKTHRAEGHWIPVRDIYRNSRMLNADETMKQLSALDRSGAVHLISERPARVRCTCSAKCRNAVHEDSSA